MIAPARPYNPHVQPISELCRLYASEGLIHNAHRVAFYLDTVFERVRFEGARVLDVGSGTGIVSCYAAFKGASQIVALDPEGAGGPHDARRTAAMMFSRLGVESKIESCSETIQAFQAAGVFDVIVLHNSINHLDEAACIALREKQHAREVYLGMFDRLAKVSRPGAQLFVSDCSPRNVFPEIGRRNPVARTIDWRKHQRPEEWIELLEQAGFDSPALAWTPVTRFYRAGKALTGNRLVSYFTTSHFYFTMTRR